MNESMEASPRRRVWDAPQRVLHALLAVCVAGAWLTRSAESIDLHAAFGYGALAAVLLRVAWGFVGTRHARFRDFAYSPRAALAYLSAALRGRAPHFTGHNPAGSWAVYLLLASVGIACATGLVAIAGMHAMGPLAATAFESALVEAAWGWHEALAWIVLALAVLHLAGVAWGSHVHRENLAAAMVTGIKRVHGSGQGEVRRHGAFAIALLAVAGLAATAYLSWHAPRATAALQARDEALVRAAASTAWHKECSSCHLAYHPALLPLRSWRRMLEEQERHFGEDLSLAPAVISKLLQEASAGPGPSWSAAMLAASVGDNQAPLRITELARWSRLHARMRDDDFKPPRVAGRHECDGCHADARSGTFHPRLIHKEKRRSPS